MKIVSYAQNFEDVLLWRALKHVEHGFYIDVGANDPEADSVTKTFYDHGWHGINIEPLPEYQRQLAQQRPRDINLAVAAGAVDGTLTLFDFPDMRGWASPDAAVAAAHAEHGLKAVELKVPVQALANICEQHVKGDIHFLKIDVEGFEAEVIRGMDFEKWRPWIVIVEATLPNSQIANFAAWEGGLTAHRYQFAYFDGLNRYYVAAEHQALAAALTVQPNVFDDFVTLGQVHAEEATRQSLLRTQYAEQSAQRAEQATQLAIAREQQANERAQQADDQAQQAQQKAQLAEQAAAQAAAQLVALHASLSWRVTRPLRWGKRVTSAILRRLRGGQPVAIAAQSSENAGEETGPNSLQQAGEISSTPRHTIRQTLKRVARATLMWLLSFERLKIFVRRRLAAFPRIEHRLRTLAFRLKGSRHDGATWSQAELSDEVAQLPANARAIYRDLQRAFEGQH